MASRADLEIARLIFKQPCIFNGENVEEFLSSVDEYAEAMQIPENLKSKFLLNYLDPCVKSEIKSDLSFTEELCTIKKILVDTYKKKKSAITPYMMVGTLYQRPSESIKEFSKRVKISVTGIHMENKEEMSKKIFIKGLLNKSYKFGLKLLNPKNIDEAVKLIKEETDVSKPESEDLDMPWDLKHIKSDENNIIERLKAENLRLKQYIAKLKERRNSSKIRLHEKSMDDVTCFKCKQKGHYARFCKTIECFRCGGPHLQRFCRTDVKDVKYLNTEERSITSEEDNVSTVDTLSEKDCNMLDMGDWKQVKPKKSRQSHFNSIEDNYAQFVNGQGAKPSRRLSKADTVITNRRPEKAKNKPIVDCRVEDEKVKILFDTGAERNVISEDLVNRLMKKDDSIKMRRSPNRIRCANGSIIKPSGQVYLRVVIGAEELFQYFDVVPELFPECFIGIRYMKKDGISVVPSKDCIKIKGIEIPFVSKTQIESLNC